MQSASRHTASSLLIVIENDHLLHKPCTSSNFCVEASSIAVESTQFLLCHCCLLFIVAMQNDRSCQAHDHARADAQMHLENINSLNIHLQQCKTQLESRDCRIRELREALTATANGGMVLAAVITLQKAFTLHQICPRSSVIQSLGKGCGLGANGKPIMVCQKHSALHIQAFGCRHMRPGGETQSFST